MKKLLLMLCVATQFSVCADREVDSNVLIELALCSVAAQLVKLYDVADDQKVKTLMLEKLGLLPSQIANAGWHELADLAEKIEKQDITNIQLYDQTFDMIKDLYDLFNEYGIVSEERQQLTVLIKNSAKLSN